MICPNLSVFISYASKDQEELNEFYVHLSSLERLGLIEVWHPGKVTVGADRAAIIEAQLEKADIVLLLLSPDFLADKEAWQQLERAVELRTEKDKWVAPIYLRPCYWQDHEVLRSLQILPRTALPIKVHPSIDQAYTNVIEELATAIRERFPEAETNQTPPPPVFTTDNLIPMQAAPSPAWENEAASAKTFPQLSTIVYDNRYGLQNEAKQMVTEFIYEATNDISGEGLKGVCRNGKWTFVNAKGKEIFEPSYASVRSFSGGLAGVSDGKRWGFINRRGKLVIPYQYEEIGLFTEGYAAVVINEKVGYINTKGKLIIPAIYRRGFPFREGLAKVCEGILYGFVNANQELVIPLTFEESGSSEFNGGLVLVKNEAGLGALNRDGEIVLPFGHFKEFTELTADLQTGRVCYRCLETKQGEHLLVDEHLNVMANLGPLRMVNGIYDSNLGLYLVVSPKGNLSQLGLYDLQGRVIIPPDFQQIIHLGKGILAVQKENLWGLMRLSGEPLSLIEYHQVFSICGDLIKVQKGNKLGAINLEGQEVYACIYDDINIYTPKAILIQKNGHWSFNDRRGKNINKNSYSEYRLFSEAWFSVKRGDRYGFVNLQGKEKIVCQYLKTGDFSEGLCWVNTVEGKIGFINREGKMQIPAEYVGAGDFSEGLAPVAKNFGWLSDDIRYGFIDANKQERIPFEYEAAAGFQEGAAPVKKAGKWGFIKKDGKALTKFIYEDVKYFVNGVAEVKKEGKWSSITWKKRY